MQARGHVPIGYCSPPVEVAANEPRAAWLWKMVETHGMSKYLRILLDILAVWSI